LKKLIVFFLLFPASVLASESSASLAISCEVVSVMTLRVNYPKLSGRIAFERDNFALKDIPEISYSCSDKCLLQVSEDKGIKVFQLSSNN
jgi:hypothetical protein